MAIIAGQRYSTHLSTEARAKRDVKEEINLLEPDAYPLTAILNKAENRLKVTGNKVFEWFEDELLPRFSTLDADLTSDAVTMTVATGTHTYFRKGDLVRVNKGELVLVTATPTSATVSIQRAFGTTAAVAASSGAQLHILANLSDEGSTVGAKLATQKVLKQNICAIIKTPYQVSGTAQATDVYGTNDVDYEIAKSIIEHAKNIEYLNMLGEYKQDTTNYVNLAQPRGVLSFISTNVKNAGVEGTLTEAEWEEFVRIAFRYGNKTKLFFGSSKVCQVITGFARSKLQVAPSSALKYGVTLSQYIYAGKTVLITEHPLFENEDVSDLTGLMGTGVMIDIGDLSYRYMKGRYMKKSQVKPDSDTTLLDGTVGQILTEGGLQLEQEKKHAILTGVQS